MIDEPSINQRSGHSHIFWQIPAASCHLFAVVLPWCRVSRHRTYQKGQQRVSGHLKGWMNQSSPYGVYPSWEVILPTVLEECFNCIQVDLGASLKTLAVVQDEARVSVWHVFPLNVSLSSTIMGDIHRVEFAWQSAGWHESWWDRCWKCFGQEKTSLHQTNPHLWVQPHGWQNQSPHISQVLGCGQQSPSLAKKYKRQIRVVHLGIWPVFVAGSPSVGRNLFLN